MHLFRFLFYLFIYVCMWAIVCTCVSMYACTEAYACAIVLYRSMNHMHTYIHIQNIHTVHVCRHVCMCILHNYTDGSISLCACVCTEAYTQRGGEGEREREVFRLCMHVVQRPTAAPICRYLYLSSTFNCPHATCPTGHRYGEG